MSESQPSAGDVYFNQACPVCGRTLHVRVQLLGHRVYCQHCGGGFTAVDASLRGEPAALDLVDDLIARATRALQQASCGDDGDCGLSG